MTQIKPGTNELRTNDIGEELHRGSESTGLAGYVVLVGKPGDYGEWEGTEKVIGPMTKDEAEKLAGEQRYYEVHELTKPQTI